MSLNKFTWSFSMGSMGENPTQLSCVTTSVAAAREMILVQLAKITVHYAEFERLRSMRLDSTSDSAARKKASTDLYAKLDTIEIDAFIGCYTADVWFFTEDAKIDCGEKSGYGDERLTPLKDFINTKEPVVTPFRCVSLRSCLKG
jgi:hypothetical protein